MEGQDNDQSQSQQVTTSGVLIDNDTGDTTEPHPLSFGAGGGSNDDANDQDQNNQGDDNDDDGQQTSDVNQGDDDNSGGGGQGAAATTPPQPAQSQQAQTQVQATRLEDPGEFVPNKDSQYSFDVTLADGSKYRIEKPEDIDKLPPVPEFATVQDHARFNASYTRMISGLDNDKRDWDKTRADFAKQEEQQAAFDEEFNLMTNGLAYLEKEGSLPAVPAQYENADWANPEVAKQPGVKERVDLLSFMFTENNKRTAAGLPKMSVLDAFEKMQNNALKEKMAQRTQKQNEMRKQRGAMVSGPSAPSPGSRVGNDMIVGSGGSLRDL